MVRDCIKCGQVAEFKEGISKKNGKPYQMYKCTNKECGFADFVKDERFKGSKSPTPNLAPSFGSKSQEMPVSVEKKPIIESMSKADWAEKDASIASLALCKVKAVAGCYRDADGNIMTCDEVNEAIYEDYIFFFNRIRKEE